MGAVWRWLASAFTENLGLKLLAFTFALGLFAYQRFGEDNQQRTIPVGVVLRLPPESSKARADDPATGQYPRDITGNDPRHRSIDSDGRRAR